MMPTSLQSELSTAGRSSVVVLVAWSYWTDVQIGQWTASLSSCHLTTDCSASNRESSIVDSAIHCEHCSPSSISLLFPETLSHRVFALFPRNELPKSENVANTEVEFVVAIGGETMPGGGKCNAMIYSIYQRPRSPPTLKNERTFSSLLPSLPSSNFFPSPNAFLRVKKSSVRSLVMPGGWNLDRYG